jgi:hypothetical protein
MFILSKAKKKIEEEQYGKISRGYTDYGKISGA